MGSLSARTAAHTSSFLEEILQRACLRMAARSSFDDRIASRARQRVRASARKQCQLCQEEPAPRGTYIDTFTYLHVYIHIYKFVFMTLRVLALSSLLSPRPAARPCTILFLVMVYSIRPRGWQLATMQRRPMRGQCYWTRPLFISQSR